LRSRAGRPGVGLPRPGPAPRAGPAVLRVAGPRAGGTVGTVHAPRGHGGALRRRAAPGPAARALPPRRLLPGGGPRLRSGPTAFPAGARGGLAGDARRRPGAAAAAAGLDAAGAGPLPDECAGLAGAAAPPQEARPPARRLPAQVAGPGPAAAAGAGAGGAGG